MSHDTAPPPPHLRVKVLLQLRHSACKLLLLQRRHSLAAAAIRRRPLQLLLQLLTRALQPRTQLGSILAGAHERRCVFEGLGVGEG